MAWSLEILVFLGLQGSSIAQSELQTSAVLAENGHGVTLVSTIDRYLNKSK